MDPTEEEAFALFRRLINDYPDSEWADASLYTIAMGHYRKESYDRALLLFDKVIKEYPTSHLVVEAEFNRAMCYYGKGNWKEALEEFDKFEEKYRDNKLVHSARFYKGMVFSDKREYDTARVEFQNIVDAGFKDLAPDAQFNIGHTYFAEGRYDDAIAAYKKTINEYPNTKSGEYAEFYIGEALQKQGKNEEAIAQLEQAVTKYPDNEKAAVSQLFIAEIYFTSMEDVEKAAEVYRKVADNDKNEYDWRREAQYRIGKIYENSNQISKAVEEYQKLNKQFQWPHSIPTHPSNDIDEGYIENMKAKASGE
jgi:TolA-binding protein